MWSLKHGLSPLFSSASSTVFEMPPFVDTRLKDVSIEFQIPPVGMVTGHNTMSDDGVAGMMGLDPNTPISPLLAKDLAGRVVYLGYGPEVKDLAEWNAYGAASDAPRDNVHAYVQNVTFPRNCAWVNPKEVKGAELIEQVFFTKFRTLDMSADYNGQASGEDEYVAGVYSNPHRYPYKLRLDTFYTDGYKLPQTQMVFARQDVSAASANAAAKSLMEAWNNRAATKDYTAFVEAQGGEDWAEKMFQRGCTLVPTFEACNGFNMVSEDFELIDYYPGRAVTGLHLIEESRASDTPTGTILEVLEPGYVTATHVHPARVVVSDGSQYLTPHAENPAPMLPNFALPHSRTAVNWGGIWLPTHPGHFEAPALWGWDPLTGRFLQLAGPIWDPLHYYYESVDLVLEAFQTPRPDNRWLVDVPDEMEGRFYPIVPMKGFDTLNFREKEQRFTRGVQPYSACVRTTFHKNSADVGYHPLPPQFEFEIETWWFPDLHPLNRAGGDCPGNLLPLLAPVITSTLDTKTYADSIDAPDYGEWLTDRTRLKATVGDTMVDYPFLVRYTDPELPATEALKFCADVYLAHMSDEQLNKMTQETWAGLDDYESLEGIASGLFDAVWELREQGRNILKLRHEIYRNNRPLYALAWWFGWSPMILEELYYESQREAAPKPMPRRTNAGIMQASPVAEG